MGVPLDKKWLRAHEITQNVQHIYLTIVKTGISLHTVGFELFKKVLLVALGVWLSILLVTGNCFKVTRR